MFVTLSPWRSWGHGYPECIPKFCNNQPDQPQISYQENWDNCLQNPENHQTKNLGAGPHWLPYYYFMVFYYHIHAKVILTWFPKKHPMKFTPQNLHADFITLKCTLSKTYSKISTWTFDVVGRLLNLPLGIRPIFSPPPKRWWETSGGPISSGVETHGKARSCFGQRYLTPPRSFGWQPPHRWRWLRLAQVSLHLGDIMKHTKHMKKNRWKSVIVYVCLCKCQWYPSQTFCSLMSMKWRSWIRSAHSLAFAACSKLW